MTAARLAQLRADLADALQRRVDLELRWAVATHTASGTDRPEDLDVDLARADATIAALREVLAAAEPAQSGQTAVNDPAPEAVARAPSLTQDRLSGAGGYLAPSAPVAANPGATPNAEPEYLTTREAAALLRTSADTLERMRARGDGPPWRRVGRCQARLGHTLRHTYSNAARLAGVDDVDRELLLAHRIPGVQGVYLHTPTLFTRLLEQQAKVSTYLLAQIASQ